jgi:pimeloyl-ACP methyl ester carboxylesterase
MSPETIKWMYTKGEKHPETIPPEAYSLDTYLVSRPGQEDIQLGLFADYRHNVELYPKWQNWLEEYQPPTLAVWGKNDEIFIPPGAEAFKKYVKKAEVVLIEDAGHFVLENHAEEVVRHVRAFAHKHGLC